MAQSAQVQKLSPWHLRLADWLISDGQGPGWNKRAAQHFGVSQAWLSTIFHSDAFQEYFQALNARTSQSIAVTVKDKMLGVASLAMDHLAERVENEGGVMPVGSLLEVVDVLAKRTGHGEKGSGEPAQTNIQVNVVTREQLAEARALMRGGKVPLLAGDSPPSDDTGGA
jgi:hypothetical protein